MIAAAAVLPGSHFELRSLSLLTLRHRRHRAAQSLVVVRPENVTFVTERNVIVFFNKLCAASVARYAASVKDGSQYFVLLIITDGVISDMAQTKESIVNVRASVVAVKT
ncbi:copine-8 [Lates japonicus]|uniref:Copine-8 n=1 Tax=Lates japonicus TaxID=270547 RepID=A0AAD3M178_LATJO|nr:copine-8 [Lates japonicus]